MRISDLKDSDVGRQVIYTAHHGERQAGVISSWNKDWVFVRYGMGSTSAATDPEQLTFAMNGVR